MMSGEEPPSILRKRNVPKDEPDDPPPPETLTRRVVRTLKKADMYTKVQTMHSHIITPTPVGAVVSVFVVFILFYLFFGELSTFTQVEYVTNFKIFDVSDKSAATPTGGKLRLTFDVSFEHLPCEFVSVDYLDMFGTHNFNLHNNINRKSIMNNDDTKGRTARRGRKLLQLHPAGEEHHDAAAHLPDVEHQHNSEEGHPPAHAEHQHNSEEAHPPAHIEHQHNSEKHAEEQHPETHAEEHHEEAHHVEEHHEEHHDEHHAEEHHDEQHPEEHHDEQHPEEHHAEEHPETHAEEHHEELHHAEEHHEEHHDEQHPEEHPAETHPEEHHAEEHPETHAEEHHEEAHHVEEHHEEKRPEEHHDEGGKDAGVYSKGVVANPKQVGGKPAASKPKPLGDEVKKVPTAADNKDKKNKEAKALVAKKPSFHDNKPEIKIGGVKLKIVDGAGLHEIVEGGDHHDKAYDGTVVKLDGGNFRAYLADHDTVMIDFFAPWCIWCQRLAPVWTATAKAVAEAEDLGDTTSLATVDCTTEINRPICRNHRVHAYPTIYTYKAGKLLSLRPYRGDRSTLALLKFLRNLPEPTKQKDPEKVRGHESDKGLLNFYNGPAGKAKGKGDGDGLSMGDCVAWRQTAGCDPKGKREPWNDSPCTSLIYNRNSGYCECKGGVRCMEIGCNHDKPYFTCEEECRKAVKDRDASGEDAAPQRADTQTGLERVNAAVTDFEKNIAERYGGVTNQGDHDAKGSDRSTGCTVAGFLEINKVPGSLLFTAASPWHDFATEEVDMTHTVNQFYFDELRADKEGAADDDMTVRLRTALSGANLDLQLNTMRNKTYHSLISNRRMPHISHEHFLKMIETKFSHDRSSEDLHAGFQYTATSHKFSVAKEEGVLPSVRMIFNIDPIGVHISVKPKYLYKFLTSSCAILGGVFTVFGLIDKAIHSILFRTPSGNPNFSPK